MLRALVLIVLPVFLLATSNSMAEEQSIYVKAGQLVDVIDGRMRQDQVIVIGGDRITASRRRNADRPVAKDRVARTDRHARSPHR